MQYLQNFRITNYTKIIKYQKFQNQNGTRNFATTTSISNKFIFDDINDRTIAYGLDVCAEFVLVDFHKV